MAIFCTFHRKENLRQLLWWLMKQHGANTILLAPTSVRALSAEKRQTRRQVRYESKRSRKLGKVQIHQIFPWMVDGSHLENHQEGRQEYRQSHHLRQSCLCLSREENLPKPPPIRFMLNKVNKKSRLCQSPTASEEQKEDPSWGQLSTQGIRKKRKSQPMTTATPTAVFPETQETSVTSPGVQPTQQSVTVATPATSRQHLEATTSPGVQGHRFWYQSEAHIWLTISH